MRPIKILFLIVLFGLFAGCSGQFASPNPNVSLPTPSALPLFGDPGASAISNQSVAGLEYTLAPAVPASKSPFSSPADAPFPTPARLATATWLPTQPPPPGPVEVPVYTDSLSSGWEVVSPEDEMHFDLQSKDQVHSGSYAIAITPNKSHGKIYIVAGRNNSGIYPRPKVLGISLWIYSGERGLDQYDLALTAIGSNDYTYWREDDYSVISKTPYEETFLRWFGYDQNIPPFTWAQIQIWLNEMRFDPDYKNVTGLYITNRQGFTRTFYIDDVSLQLQPDSLTTPTPQPEP